ncbi:metal/formaldehyde-sensitive transcriptional repressor [Ensifer sp. LCM 4579]|uniref:metal/formaldehyde-sensitive transcriptional repressor n=1 Tax=Ensifer sp. LCM 4579 TaxID=1848292 RepID=UPI0008DA2DAD|nr:metal/formaldehyde-sensitive transcriptional repressor [Ensifer sp. LCM 4579]OHV83880.1 transcriptional regulator [Ensifer sp. LCM 4579]
MAHTIRQKEKLMARVRRLKGQLDGVEKALAAEVACGEVLRQLASIRGAVSGLTAELMEDHLRGHVLHADSETDRREGAEEMIEVIRTYLK